MANKPLYKSLPDSKLERKRNIDIHFNHEQIVIPESLKKFAKGKTYFIHTFGCQANYRDEEIMAGMLEKMGYTKSDDINSADFILLNN